MFSAVSLPRPLRVRGCTPAPMRRSQPQPRTHTSQSQTNLERTQRTREHRSDQPPLTTSPKKSTGHPAQGTVPSACPYRERRPECPQHRAPNDAWHTHDGTRGRAVPMSRAIPGLARGTVLRVGASSRASGASSAPWSESAGDSGRIRGARSRPAQPPRAHTRRARRRSPETGFGTHM